MKTIEQLEKLSGNPFYTLTPEEQQRLEESRAEESLDGDESPKKLTRGNAAVKEIGKLDKHSADPVSE